MNNRRVVALGISSDLFSVVKRQGGDIIIFLTFMLSVHKNNRMKIKSICDDKSLIDFCKKNAKFILKILIKIKLNNLNKINLFILKLNSLSS